MSFGSEIEFDGIVSSIYSDKRLNSGNRIQWRGAGQGRARRYLGEPALTDDLAGNQAISVISMALIWSCTGARSTSSSAFGRNVNPEWVESELVQQLPIAQAWLYGRALPANVAVLVPRFSSVSDAELAAAVEQVNQTLPDYARVHHWLRGEQAFTDDNGLATSNGRLRRWHYSNITNRPSLQVMAGETVY